MAAGTETLPSDEVLQAKEEADRAKFREMMMEKGEETGLVPVLSGPVKEADVDDADGFQPSHEKEDLEDKGLSKRLGNLLKQSVLSSTTTVHINSGDEFDEPAIGIGIDDQDVKGRYYFDKFQLTPFDHDEHRALRKAYIEGLVWNLKYYFEGCVSWSWYYPYHYGTFLLCHTACLIR